MATATIPDLWPTLNFDAVAPEVILAKQVELLKKRGRGVLDAELVTVSGMKGAITYQFDLVAPKLDSQRYRILSATRKPEEFYPVTIEADCFRHEVADSPTGGRANSDEEFVEKVGQVLRSSPVLAAINSFIARTNQLDVELDRSEANVG